MDDYEGTWPTESTHSDRLVDSDTVVWHSSSYARTPQKSEQKASPKKEETKKPKKIAKNEPKQKKENANKSGGIFGLFSSKSSKPAVSRKTIPDEFCCPITLDLMQHPVLCTLDGRSYEEHDIREWLTKHRSSPYNRKMMASGQTCDDVLVKNYNLEEAISKFKNADKGKKLKK